MELKNFTELFDRIQFEPSILLLGQNYLSLGGEKDLVWHKIANDFYAQLDLPQRKADYPALWQQAVKSTADAEKVMSQISEAGLDVRPNPAINAIVQLRWSLLYTSAIDDTEALATDRGYTPVPQEEKNAKHQYLNKDRRYRVNLCGNRDYAPPVLNTKSDQKIFNRQIANKIAWISNAYLEYYGVLIIDGFDPESDWLNDDNLFEQLLELPAKSVYWFSAPEHLEENASLLVEQGILTVEEDGFFEHLLRHMPELLDFSESEQTEDNDPLLYAALTLKFNGKQTQTIHVRRSDISGITGANLCLIDDNILQGNVPAEKNRAQIFADFLSQTGLPSWNLFLPKPGEISFYFDRDKDQELMERVKSSIKETGVARKPVILWGPSNSGKTMMLANLALTIAKQRKYPVIFIRGELLQGAEKRLDDFVNNWFCDTDRLNGERLEKTIVIWDGGGLKRTEKDYETLQKLLFNRNVQVVGSLYTSISKNYVELKQALSPREEKRLKSVLNSLGTSYSERYDEIIRTRGRVKTLENSSLLYLLQALFRYEFDAEYEEVSKILKKQFNQEKRYAEQAAGTSLEEYVEDFFETQKKIIQDGVASSFQEKLRLILAKMTVQERDSTNKEMQQVPHDEQAKKIEKLKQLSKSIENMNQVLSVASEFGVQLPLHLLLKCLQDERGNKYISFDSETTKIVEVLRNDSLIDFVFRTHYLFGEEYYVGFRNSIEAENYICILCDLPLGDHSKKRKDKEIDILKYIIQTAESEAELWSVIELVRQFGPSGHGMLSELEDMRRKQDYRTYKDYWPEIADLVIEHFPDDFEATHVYAHLSREYINLEDGQDKVYYEDRLKDGRTRLEIALRKMEDNQQVNTSQYDRLSVELSANYQQGMRDYGYDAVTYHDIKERIRAAFRRSTRQDVQNMRREFSSNNLLDILLNAYAAYRSANTDRDENELAELLCDIDNMLNLDDLIYEKTAHDLVNKIKCVYDQLGTDAGYTTQLAKNLLSKNSDAFLYLQARLIWQEASPCQHTPSDDRNIEMLYTDRYMIICRDVPYTRTEILPELLKQAQCDAERVVDFLAQNQDLIRQTRSARCIAMLLRSKWLLKTGNPMLAEKQRVAFSRNDWIEINDLCNRYDTYYEIGMQDEFVPAYFLKGIYEWVYGNPKKAIEWFNKAKEHGYVDKTVDRLILCKEGSNTPRTFIVSVQRNENKKYTAKILSEILPTSDDSVTTRYGMGVSDAVVKYLFDGTMPTEQHQRAKKEGVIRFNLIGAQIGIPEIGGSNDGK